MKTAKEYRLEAKEALKGNWGMAILAYIIYTAVIGLITYFTVVGGIFSGVLGVGMAAMWINLYRSGKLELSDLFAGFKNGFVNALVMSLLQSLFTFLWSLLFFVPGIVASYSYAMAPYILADNPTMSGLQAITASKNLMKGNKWKLFCVQFSFFGWAILSILTFGILSIWINPWMSATMGSFYEDIKDELDANS